MLLLGQCRYCHSLVLVFVCAILVMLPFNFVIVDYDCVVELMDCVLTESRNHPESSHYHKKTVLFHFIMLSPVSVKCLASTFH